MDEKTTPLEDIPYDLSENEIRNLIAEHYNIVSEKIKRMDGYDDFNFYISPPTTLNKPNDYTRVCLNGYLLKVLSWENSRNIEFISEYINVLLHLREKDVKCPFPVQNNKGDYKTYWRKKKLHHVDEKVDPVSLESLDRVHVALLFDFIPGKLLSNTRFEEKFCLSLGHLVGELHNAMKPFSSSVVLQRPHFPWSLKYVADSLKYLKFVQEDAKRSMIIKAIKDFQNDVLPRMNELEQGIIHGDLNKANIVIFEKDKNDVEVRGIIDFSDISHSAFLFDLAIIALYMSMDEPDKLENITASILAAYPRKITDLEIDLFKTCICARIAQSLILGLYSYHLFPSNTYLLTTQKQGWPLLEQLQNQSNANFTASIKEKILLYRIAFNV